MTCRTFMKDASTNTEECPVRNCRGHPDLTEGVTKRHDLGARNALLDSGEESIIDVLTQPLQRISLVCLVERNVLSRAEKLRDVAGADQRFVDAEGQHPGDQVACCAGANLRQPAS